jgi:hypothetical protein
LKLSTNISATWRIDCSSSERRSRIRIFQPHGT